MMLNQKKVDWEWKIIWRLFFMYIILHVFASVGFYYVVTGQVQLKTLLCAYWIFLMGAYGVGPVSHNYYSHKSYKAWGPFQWIMLMCQTISGCESAYDWVRIHRGHHKYHDTSNDPLYLGRGVFYVYFVRWFNEEPPEMTKALDNIYKLDLERNKKVMFQHTFYPYLVTIISGVLPCVFPIYFWNEPVKIAFFVNMFRWFCNWSQYCISNTFAHMFGTRPHDKDFSAANNWISHIILLGEGYHNFHHVFPFDYSCSEPGSFMDFFNWGRYVIDFGALIGVISHRKVVSPGVVAKRSLRTGDGSKYYDPHDPEPEVWEVNNNNTKDNKISAIKSQNEIVKPQNFDVPEMFQPKSCEYEFYSSDVARKCL